VSLEPDFSGLFLGPENIFEKVTIGTTKIKVKTVRRPQNF
jgi:hypothetical protein